MDFTVPEVLAAFVSQLERESLHVEKATYKGSQSNNKLVDFKVAYEGLKESMGTR